MPRGVCVASLAGSAVRSLLNLLRSGTENTDGEWPELPTCRVGCHSVMSLSGAQCGGCHFFLPWELISGPQEVGASAGRGSLTPIAVEGSFSGSVQAFRIPSRRVALYLVTVPAAR